MRYLLTLLLLLTSSLASPTAKPAQETEAYRVPVTTVNAKTEEITEITRVQGVIEAVRAPEIRNKVAAEVIEILVDEGDKVSTGQVLARLDDESFRLDKEVAKADIQRLSALLENLQQTLKRDQSLFAQKLISDSRLDDDHAAVKQTRAQLGQARAMLNKAKYQLSHTEVRSPMDGVVQMRNASVGDYINPMSPSSKPLFQVVDTHHLRARLYFPENLNHRIAQGTRVILEKGTDQLPTQLQQIRPMLESQSRALHALAPFENRYRWRPGESISAKVILTSHPEAITVPRGALIRRPVGLVVYVVDGGKAKEIPVTTGILAGDRVEILSGLQGNETLALDGAAYLADDVALSITGAAQ